MKQDLSKVMDLIKKHIGIVTLLTYQYVIWFAILVGVLAANLVRDGKISNGMLFVFYVVYAISTLVTLIVTAIIVTKLKKGTYSVHEAVLTNLIIKGCNTPVNLVNIIAMIYFMGAKQNGMLIFLIIVTCTASIMTTMYFIACSKVMKEAGMIGTAQRVMAPICGLIIGVDIIISINYVKKALDIKGDSLTFTVLELVKESVGYIPLIIYPYIYYAFFILLLKVDFDTIELIAIIYNILILAFILYLSIKNSQRDTYTVATMNFLVKLAHVPAYLLHIMIFCLGMCLGVFGGFLLILWALMLLILPMIISGINNISCTAKMKKAGLISTPKAFINIILGFVCVIDLFVALGYVMKATKREVTKRIDIDGAVGIVKDTVKNADVVGTVDKI